MTNFSENIKLQKNLWFVVSTLTFIVTIFYFRFKDFIPYGIGFCIGYVVLICIGFVVINAQAEKRKK